MWLCRHNTEEDEWDQLKFRFMLWPVEENTESTDGAVSGESGEQKGTCTRARLGIGRLPASVVRSEHLHPSSCIAGFAVT